MGVIRWGWLGGRGGGGERAEVARGMQSTHQFFTNIQKYQKNNECDKSNKPLNGYAPLTHPPGLGRRSQGRSLLVLERQGQDTTLEKCLRRGKKRHRQTCRRGRR